MAWAWIAAAGLCEIAWAVGLKLSDGLRKPGLAAFTVAGMILSFALLAQGMKRLPAGTAYAVWTGIGAAGTAIIGMLWLGEARTAARVASLALIVVGIVGLRLAE